VGLCPILAAEQRPERSEDRGNFGSKNHSKSDESDPEVPRVHEPTVLCRCHRKESALYFDAMDSMDKAMASREDSPAYIEHVPCNLCGAQDQQVVFRKEPLNERFVPLDVRMTTDVYSGYGRIVKCRGCGLVYQNPRPSRREIQAAYARLQDEEYLQEQECRSINAHLSLRVIKKHIREGRLLDVGCATGFFLNAARLDFEVHGIEPSQWAASFANQRLRLRVVQGSLEDAHFSNGYFDAMSMVDVIEHMTDPLAALQSAASLLRPGGILYLVTPDIESISARLLRGYWWGLRPAHLYYFSENTLRSMLKRTGFEVVDARAYGRMFTCQYWLSRLREYPSVVSKSVGLLLNTLSIQDKVVYINTRDSLEVCAIRSDG
jgi:2-polyprenyl-3-methyl-5-hydroxy-6-metoxy-1,4-benzoquinol methylase